MQYLGTWSYREIKTLSYHFKEENYSFDQIVTKQNLLNEHIYVVRSGVFELFYEYIDYENLREHKETELLRRILP